MINKYQKRSRISEAKFRQIIKLFSLDIEATKIAELTGLSRKTINRILYKIRVRIAEYCLEQSPFDVGEVEIDESDFGARRVCGIRGRGERDEHIVFGLIQRGGKVYTQVVKNCSQSTLMPVIRQKVDIDSRVYADGFKTYDGLVDFGDKKHYRVKNGDNGFENGTNHINGIESFWAIAKGRLNKFRGISKATFALHLKECEFRFNHRQDDLYKLLLKILRDSPI
jgi:transposase-like protein